MSHVNVIRAWKDEEYRQSLSPAERAQLPAHPAGLIDLTDAAMAGVDGGIITVTATPVTVPLTITITVTYTVVTWAKRCF